MFFLAAALLTLVLSAFPARAAVISKAEKVLFKEGDEAFLELVQPQKIGQHYVQKGYSELAVWSPESPVLAVESDEFVAQVQYTVKMQESNGVGFTIECIKTFVYVPYAGVVDVGSVDLTGENTYIRPYGSFSYGSGSPRCGNPRYEIVVVSGTDDNGHELEFYGIIERLNFTSQEGAGGSAPVDKAHDTVNLRHNANFEVEVADGVWWVPAAALGESRYTNSEIAAQVQFSPEEKQQNIATLYEALQLFQIGNFANGNDNQRIEENGVMWEHHKPGYHAVRTNEGCCATDSNWLNYILWDDYDELGFMAYSQSDGSGHVFNYIRQGEYYYFMDLTHYRTDFLDSSAIETGIDSDYYNSDFIAGNIHKAVSPEAFAAYYRACANDPAELFFCYQAEDCLPVDGVRSESGICITYADAADIRVVHDDPGDQLTYAFVEPPVSVFAWESMPDAVFRVDDIYLSSDNTESEEPFFEPGDVLTFVDYGQEATFAEINGEDYSSCGRQTYCKLSFEEDILLMGGCHYGDLNYELDSALHEQACANMESLRLGELMIDLLGEGSNMQIARCVEEDGALRVTDVICGDDYFEQMYIRKDDQGNWQPTEKIWYVIHYQLGDTIMKEFGRFACGTNG